MATTETTAPGVCQQHADRPAVGTCGRCGRTLCLECAIPFRGGLRCDACAAIELGDPAPPPAPRRPRIGLPRAAPALLLLALVATIPPWHRSGTLTSTLSAWRPSLDPWATIGSVTVALAAAVLLVALRRAHARGWTSAGGGLAAAGAVATLVSLVRAPDFFTATPAPFVTLLAAAAGAILAWLVAKRHRA